MTAGGDGQATNRLLDRRPGNVTLVAAGTGKARLRGELVGAAARRLYLFPRQQVTERLRHRVRAGIKPPAERAQIAQQVSRDLLPAKLPYDRAQLRLFVKTEDRK